MKNLLLILSIFLIPLQAQAFEDYIIVSEKPVNAVFSGDESIVSALPFFTIDNNKSSILLKMKKEGDAVVTIETIEGDKILNITVGKDETVIQKIDGFSYFSLDVPKGGR